MTLETKISKMTAFVYSKFNAHGCILTEYLKHYNEVEANYQIPKYAIFKNANDVLKSGGNLSRRRVLKVYTQTGGNSFFEAMRG